MSPLAVMDKKKSFLYSCKKTIHPTFTKINRVRPTVTCNIYTYEIWVQSNAPFWNYSVHSHAHAYTSPQKYHKWIQDTSKRINRWKSQSRHFFMITIFFLHNICSESKNGTKKLIFLKKLLYLREYTCLYHTNEDN